VGTGFRNNNAALRTANIFKLTVYGQRPGKHGALLQTSPGPEGPGPHSL